MSLESLFYVQRAHFCFLATFFCQGQEGFPRLLETFAKKEQQLAFISGAAESFDNRRTHSSHGGSSVPGTGQIERRGTSQVREGSLRGPETPRERERRVASQGNGTQTSEFIILTSSL